MAALVTLLLLGWLSLAWCCSPDAGATNVAREGEVSQSSDFTEVFPITAYATKAIDGVKEPNWFRGSCTHTKLDRDPWWKLNLKKKHKVNVVVVYGRSDCCMDRLRDLEVRIGDSPDNNNPVCGKILQTSNAKSTFCCNGMEGQYISLVIPGRNEYLSLCEVEVYGDPVNEESKICW